MRTYSFARMTVDGKETAKLEIFGEHNVFHVFHNDENVFTGSQAKTVEYIENWERGYDEIKKMLETIGRRVEFEQTIR